MEKQNLTKKERDDKIKYIQATIILEIIGKPQEYLVSTLEEMIKNMGEEKGVIITNKKIREPEPMKDNKEFYATFAEIDLEVEDILYLAIIMFKYMPAHIEVIAPELIALTNTGWTDILSELTRRLHGYEEVARVMQLQNSKMQNKLKELLGQSKDNKQEIGTKKDKNKEASKKR